MAIVKTAIPFEERVSLASIPDRPEIVESFFGRGSCPFTVVSPRDGEEHEIVVQVTELSDFRQVGPILKEYRIHGKILEIDGQKWGPQFNGCDIIFVEGMPERCSFKIIRTGRHPS